MGLCIQWEGNREENLTELKVYLIEYRMKIEKNQIEYLMKIEENQIEYLMKFDKISDGIQSKLK